MDDQKKQTQFKPNLSRRSSKRSRIHPTDNIIARNHNIFEANIANLSSEADATKNTNTVNGGHVQGDIADDAILTVEDSGETVCTVANRTHRDTFEVDVGYSAIRMKCLSQWASVAISSCQSAGLEILNGSFGSPVPPE